MVVVSVVVVVVVGVSTVGRVAEDEVDFEDVVEPVTMLDVGAANSRVATVKNLVGAMYWQYLWDT